MIRADQDPSQSNIYKLENLPLKDAEFLLASQTVQLKAHSGIVLEHMVREQYRSWEDLDLHTEIVVSVLNEWERHEKHHCSKKLGGRSA